MARQRKPYWQTDAYAPDFDPNDPRNNPMTEDVFDPAAHPRYQQILAGINAAGASDLANSRAAIQQALIAFGMIPEGFNDTLGALDDNIRNLIGKNSAAGLSTVAQLQDARKDAIKQLVNNLSARGLRRSGAKGAGLRRRQSDYNKAFAGALGKLMGMANSVYGQYAQNQFSRNQQLQDAWWQIGDQYGYAPRPRADQGNFNPWLGDDGGAGNEPSPNEKGGRWSPPFRPF